MKQLRSAIGLTACSIALTGGLFPVVVWGLSQLLFPFQANGSLVRRADGTVIGSAILGQSFQKPEYFHPRPSAAGNGYDASNSSGTNLGPTSQKLIEGLPDDPATKDVDESFVGLRGLAEQYRKENNLASDAVLPSDAVTRSASGLDPDISPMNAALQISRVAGARGISAESVRSIVVKSTKERFLGIFGEPRVNVLQLNVELDRLGK